MTQLFSDLYRYRQREKKQSKEDWLTECLAAALRALPNDTVAEVLARLTGQPQDAIATAGGELSIATQVNVGRGEHVSSTQRPDMLISIGAQPWLLFENKVSHNVDQQELEAGELESQLHRYGKWLSRQPFTVPGLKPGLVFVTHYTPVPADFMDRRGRHPAYGELSRHCSTWGHLARILDAASNGMPDTLHARALIKSYIDYLEEHGMANDYPDYKDLSGLGMFIDKADAFDKLVNGMMDRLKDLAPFAGNVKWAGAHSDEGTYSSHRWLRPEERFDKETFVATGIWFPDRGEGWYGEDVEDQTGEPVAPSPKVYLQLANSADDALNGLEGVPGEEWLRLNSDFFVFRDFASFPVDPTDRAIAIFTWLDVECAKLKSVLAR